MAAIRSKFFLTVFFLFNLLLSSYYIDVWHNSNTTSRVLPVLSVVRDGTLQIDKYSDKTIDKSFVNGHYYSDKAPFPSFLVIPFYSVYYYLFNNQNDLSFESIAKPVYIIGGILCGSIPFAIIILITFLYVHEEHTNYSVAMLSMLPIYGSFIFIFSGTFFSHVFSGALLLLAYVFLKYRKKYFLAGVFSGLGFVSELPIGLIVFIWTIQIYLNEKSFRNTWNFILGTLPSLLLLLFYNYKLTGNPTDILYNHIPVVDFPSENFLGFRYPSISALWKLIFSWYRGILFYMPILILIIVQFFRFYQFHLKGLLKNYLFIIVIAYLLLISSHEIWDGGWSYGPRHLIPIAVLLIFEGIRFLSKKRMSFLFWLISIPALLINWIAKSTCVFSVPSDFTNPFSEYILPNFLSKKFNENNMLSTNFNLQPQTASYIWLITFIIALIVLAWWERKLKISAYNT